MLRRGEAMGELTRIAEEMGAAAVYFTRAYEPWAVALELKLKSAFEDIGVALRRFGGRLMREPEEVRTSQGEPFRVYTPFWRAFAKDFALVRHRPAPEHIEGPMRHIRSDNLLSWELTPTKPDWDGGLKETWCPGEAGARAQLNEFVKFKLRTYAADRNRMDKGGTSRLSPHLAFGEISPLECWRQACAVASDSAECIASLETFLKELAWREFSYLLLFEFPELPNEPFHDAFRNFRWRTDGKHTCAWQRGRTGYPIVDAGMRELWTTGYMHNRVRMITASFLVKHLVVSWQVGEAWFWDTLVDADLANNSASWQWVAGSGADAAPYFRIFNPVLQGKKFDPDGAYVRRWVPELAGLPDAHIHAPWTADVEMLKAANVVLGKTYPLPIVEHKEARARALAAYERLKWNSV